MIEASLQFRGDPGIGLEIVGEEIERALGGAGKVTAAKASRIDLRLDDRLPADKALKLFREVLTLLGVEDARIELGGREYRFP